MRALLRVWAIAGRFLAPRRVRLVHLVHVACLAGLLGCLVARPRIARAEAPGPRTPPVHVLGIDSDDAEDQADALTGALRSRVRSAPGWSLQETQHALGMLTAALRCPQKPDAACLQRIGDQLRTDRFVWGVMSKAPGGQVTAEVHLWLRGHGDTADKEIYSDNLQDQNDETLRKIATRILDKISGSAASTSMGSLTVHAGDAEGVVWINGQKNRALEHGAATIALSAGRYDVELRAQGFATAKEENVTVVGGQDTSVALKLVPVALTSSEPPTSGGGAHIRRIAGWSLIGLGAVAEIVAGVEGIEFLSAKNDLDSARTNVSSNVSDVCDSKYAFNPSAASACNKYNQAASDRTVGVVVGLVGLVPLAVGVVLLATDSSKETGAPATTSARAEKPSFQVLPFATAHGTGGGLDIAVTF